MISLQNAAGHAPNNALVLARKKISVQRAAEPTDILWENMGVKLLKKIWRRL